MYFITNINTNCLKSKLSVGVWCKQACKRIRNEFRSSKIKAYEKFWLDWTSFWVLGWWFNASNVIKADLGCQLAMTVINPPLRWNGNATATAYSFCFFGWATRMCYEMLVCSSNTLLHPQRTTGCAKKCHSALNQYWRWLHVLMKTVNMIKARALNRCHLKALWWNGLRTNSSFSTLRFAGCFMEMLSSTFNWDIVIPAPQCETIWHNAFPGSQKVCILG